MSEDEWVHLDTEEMSDRELLILLVKGVNQIYKATCNQNSRIKNLEDWRSKITGGLAVFTLIVSVFGATLLVLVLRG